MHKTFIEQYGTEKWEEIRKLANIGEPTFSVHKIYPDNYVPRITSKACEVSHSFGSSIKYKPKGNKQILLSSIKVIQLCGTYSPENFLIQH